jgi:hypothetical protein
MSGLVSFYSIRLHGACCQIMSNRFPELDNHYARFHADKARRITERGSKCCKTAPEAMEGAIELLEELYGTTLSSKTQLES